MSFRVFLPLLSVLVVPGDTGLGLKSQRIYAGRICRNLQSLGDIARRAFPERGLSHTRRVACRATLLALSRSREAGRRFRASSHAHDLVSSG
jgi:hypothetical protein